jgi:eukaryotic-like serine/threonine-protein kinase
MPYCPECRRRIARGGRCPRDGRSAPAPSEPAVQRAPPIVPGHPVRGLIGSGGFGDVWAAVAGGREVAIKVGHGHDLASRRRLEREAAALDRVGPPHVPALLARGTLADGRAYLVMERLAGRTLAEAIAGWMAPPDLAMVRSLGAALLDSAAALADRGVCHHDLKPENVFLSGEGGDRPAARLIDFGLAREVGDAGTATITGVGAGTPEYMAPERVGGQEGDLRADVYALGAILFELVALRPPFVGDRHDVDYAQLSVRPPRPARIVPLPAALERVILRSLAKEPARRFADARALRAAFAEAFAAAVGPGASGARPPEVEAVGPRAAREPARAAEARALLPASASREGGRQNMALLFLAAEGASAVNIQAALRAFGGELAHFSHEACVCAFSHRASDQPAQQALAAARAFLAKGFARRLRLDVGTVTVQARARGPARLMSPLFTEAARYPAPEDGDGILVSAAARDMLPVACAPAPHRPDDFVLVAAGADERSDSHGEVSLLGRGGEVAALLAEAEAALAGSRPRVATVLAEAGLGKSRLAGELARRLRAGPAAVQVIALQARERTGSDGDDTFAQLLRRALGLPPEGGSVAGGAPEGLAEQLPRSTPETQAAAALALGWIGLEHPAVQSMRAAPGVLRASAARAGMQALCRLAGSQPVAVLVDDAHLADDGLLEALEQATACEIPLWVCALARPAFAGSRPGWGERAAGCKVVPLGPLDRAAARELCRRLLEPAMFVPEPVLDRIVDRAEANPRLIGELLRDLRREGLVHRNAGGVWVVASDMLDRVSDSPLLEWLASRELEALPGDLAAHARLLSLMPGEFTVAEVEGVLAAVEDERDDDVADAFPLDAGVGIARLQRSGLLASTRFGGFTFRNELLRGSVARTVPCALAAGIHRAALAHHRAFPDSAFRLSRIAWHAGAAGEGLAAGTAYLPLAEAARERHRYLEAELFYSRCLAQLPDDQREPRLRAFRGRGIMRYRLGRQDDSLADLAQARALAMQGRDASLQADLLLEEAMALDWLFQWPRSRELGERARALFPRGAPPLLEARLLLAEGRALHRFNRDREAAPPLREADRLARTIGDEAYEVRVIANLLLGLVLPFLGLTAEAEERLSDVQWQCEEKGDDLHLLALLNNRSCLWIAHDNRQRFLEDNARVRASARRLGLPNAERYANLNSANYLYWRGECDEALSHARRMVEMDLRCFRQEGFRPDGSVLLARIQWARGDVEEARAIVDEVHRHQAAARAAGRSELLLLPNDELLLAMTTLLLAGGSGSAWEAVIERARQVAAGQELIEVLELAGEAAQRGGDLAGARRWWGEALEVGQRIPNVMAGRIRGRLAALT